MDRLVDEVDVLYLVTALQAQFHPTHDDRLAGAVDLIEQLEETLPGEFREHLSDGIPDKAVAACDFHVSVVYVFVDMVGPGQHADETRHLAQELPLPGLPRRGAAAGQNPFGRLDDDGHHAGRGSALVEHRRVVEVHPDLLGLAATVERELLVLVGQRAATQPDLHDVVVECGDFRPAIAHLGPKDPGMPAAGEHRIGVIVDHDAVGPPQHHHRHCRVDQKAGDGLEAGGPLPNRTKRRGRPVEGPNQAGQLSGTLDKAGLGRGATVVRHWLIPRS